MSNAPSKPVSFSRPKVGYFSNRPRICVTLTPILPVPVAAPFEWVCGCLLAEIAGSNSAKVMDVCLLRLLCIVR